MKYFISPSMKMKSVDNFMGLEQEIAFPEATASIIKALQTMTDDQRQTLWACSDRVALEANEWTKQLNLRSSGSPAILTYQGIQYQAMAPDLMTTEQLERLSQRLRILSGLYGVVAPFTPIQPYRLEMKAKLSVKGAADLYHYWGSQLYERLFADHEVVLNLASKEYSRAISPYLGPEDQFVTIELLTEKNGKLTQPSTAVKQARGFFVRDLVERDVTNLEDVKAFRVAGYQYSEALLTTTTFKFIKANH